jgi:minor extracellular serine protease Vpr
MRCFRWLSVRSAFGPIIGLVASLLNFGHAFAFEKSAPTTAASMSVRSMTAARAKMDAGLRIVVDQWADAASVSGTASLMRSAVLTNPRSAFSVLASPRGGEPDVLAFVRIIGADPDAVVRSQGGKVIAKVDDIVAARFPISRVDGVAALESVRAIEISKRTPAVLDSSRIRSRVKAVQDGAGGLPQAYKGDGVVVGVLDSGLDYTHPDFRTATNTSRVRALYDLSVGTDGAPCRPGQLDSLTCDEKDGTGGHGHGTHVTGIATGNGTQNTSYVGMAPDADIVFVKGIRDPESLGGFSDADVFAGTQYMFDVATALGEPAVVNLSLGGQLGPHDGSSLYEQAMSKLTRPGNIIVAAAGNAGADPIHASFAAVGSDYSTALELPFQVTAGSNTALVDIWYPDNTDISVGIVAYPPGQLGTPVFVSGAVAPGKSAQSAATDGSTPIANITIDAGTTSDPGNHSRNVLVALQTASGGAAMSDYIWSVYAFGSGTLDAWAATGCGFAPPGTNFPAAYFIAGDSHKTIGSPATARRLIAVGSFVTKSSWKDVNGDVVGRNPQPALDAISDFSSLGPTRDGRIKPDLAAPGEAIVSALSKDYPADPQTIAFGGHYQVQMGTSQASPHITGVIALMLQRNPFLTAEDAVKILTQTAVPAGGAVPNNTYGAGRLDALAALLATPDPEGCLTMLSNGRLVPCSSIPLSPAPAMVIKPNPMTTDASIGLRLIESAQVDLTIYDLQGRRVKTLQRGNLRAGYREFAWDGRDEGGRVTSNGVYFVRLLTPSHTMSARIVRSR